MKKIWTLATLFTLLAISCKKDDQADIDHAAILQYLDTKGLTFTEHESGIFYTIEEPGTGGHPGPESELAFTYIASYLDDVVLGQTAPGDTARYKLNELIEGWRIAIPLLEKGGKGEFIIPSGLAYGEYPPYGVRPNAVLRFKVELIDFQ